MIHGMEIHMSKYKNSTEEEVFQFLMGKRARKVNNMKFEQGFEE